MPFVIIIKNVSMDASAIAAAGNPTIALRKSETADFFVA